MKGILAIPTLCLALTACGQQPAAHKTEAPATVKTACETILSIADGTTQMADGTLSSKQVLPFTNYVMKTTFGPEHPAAKEISAAAEEATGRAFSDAKSHFTESKELSGPVSEISGSFAFAGPAVLAVTATLAEDNASDTKGSVTLTNSVDLTAGQILHLEFNKGALACRVQTS